MSYYKNDNYAYYDLNANRYVLKAEYIRDQYSIDLVQVLDTTGSINADATVKNFLKRASRVLYAYIYSHHPQQSEYIKYRLVKFPEYRPIILEAMGELVYSWLVTNNDLSIQNNIGIDTGKLYERIDAMSSQVPITVELMLTNEGITVRAEYEYDPLYQEEKILKGISW